MDSSEILLTGNEIFDKYRLNKNRLTNSTCELNIEYHCWMNSSLILCLTDENDLHLLDQYGNSIQFFDKSQINSSPLKKNWIISFVSYSRGFILSTRFESSFHINERIDLFEE